MNNTDSINYLGVIRLIDDLKERIWRYQFKNLADIVGYISVKGYFLFPADKVIFWLPRVVLLTYDQLLIDCLERSDTVESYQAWMGKLKAVTPFFEDNFNYCLIQYGEAEDNVSPTTSFQPFAFTPPESDTASYSATPSPVTESFSLQVITTTAPYHPCPLQNNETEVYTPQKYEPLKDTKYLPPPISA